MHVFIIAALTVDGFIARDVSHLSTRWTSREDAAFFTQRTTQAGVVVMGATTFRTINRPLPGRKTYVYSHMPQDYGFGSDVVGTSKAPQELLAELAAAGYTEVAICGGSSIYTLFLEAGVVSTLYLTHEPVVFGTGIPLFNRPLNHTLQLRGQQQLSSQTVVFEYSVTV